LRHNGNGRSRRRSGAKGTAAPFAQRVRRLERRGGRIVCLATGAAVAYILDPQDGSRRRAQLLASCRRMLSRRRSGSGAAELPSDERNLAHRASLPFRRTVDVTHPKARAAGHTTGSFSNGNSSISNVGSKA
jgi:hypothetical protein